MNRISLILEFDDDPAAKHQVAIDILNQNQGGKP